MTRSSFAREESGQALIIVALAMVVLMSGLALSVDWGYSLLMRRGMQNGADAAALAAGRLLASTYIGAGVPFEASRQQVWCTANSARAANTVSAATTGLTVSFYHVSKTVTAPAITNVVDCATPDMTPDVPDDTVFVSVRTTATYPTLLSAFSRQSIDVATSARARLAAAAGCAGANCIGLRPLRTPLMNQIPPVEVPGQGVSGALTQPNVAIWPIALHYKGFVADLADLATGRPCGQYCDPDSRSPNTTPLTLWPRNQSPQNEQYGTSLEFTGLVSFAHFSQRAASNTHQLITESDYTGTDRSLPHGQGRNGLMDNADPTTLCGGDAGWDTNGNLNNDLGEAKSCDVPNWFAWGYRGSIGVGTDWNDPSWGTFTGVGTVDPPQPLLAGRSSCASSGFAFLPRPSCTGGPTQLGDWIETVDGPISLPMAEQMRSFIARYGRIVPNSSTLGLGKAVVVHILLWDCAEQFNGGTGSGRWSLMLPPAAVSDAECADLVQSGPTVGRVHIVSAVPVTIYEGLVETNPAQVQSVKAYWGDVFGDAGVCAFDPTPSGCELNPLANSAFLVPDE